MRQEACTLAGTGAQVVDAISDWSAFSTVTPMPRCVPAMEDVGASFCQAFGTSFGEHLVVVLITPRPSPAKTF